MNAKHLVSADNSAPAPRVHSVQEAYHGFVHANHRHVLGQAHHRLRRTCRAYLTNLGENDEMPMG